MVAAVGVRLQCGPCSADCSFSAVRCCIGTRLQLSAAGACSAVLAEQTLLGVSDGNAAVLRMSGSNACVTAMQRYAAPISRRFLPLQLLASGKTLASQALEASAAVLQRVGAKRGAR